MAYPRHALLAFGGPMGNGETESWSCTLKLWNDNWKNANADTLQAYLLTKLRDYEQNVVSLMSGMGVLWNHAALFTWLKCNVIGADGKYEANSVNVIDDFRHENSDLSIYPFQLSIVASMKSARARGIGVNSRFYMPAAGTVNNTGNLSENATKQALDAVHAFVTQVSDERGIDSPDAPVVAAVSRGKKLPNGQWGEGAAYEIRSVSVDSVLDTQRRRRNQIIGSRFSKEIQQT